MRQGCENIAVEEYGSFQSGFALPDGSDLDIAISCDIDTSRSPHWVRDKLRKTLRCTDAALPLAVSTQYAGKPLQQVSCSC